MKDWCIELFTKILCMVIVIAITVILDKFVFLTAREMLWLACGAMCWFIWDTEVEK